MEEHGPFLSLSVCTLCGMTKTWWTSQLKKRQVFAYGIGWINSLMRFSKKIVEIPPTKEWKGFSTAPAGSTVHCRLLSDDLHTKNLLAIQNKTGCFLWYSAVVVPLVKSPGFLDTQAVSLENRKRNRKGWGQVSKNSLHFLWQLWASNWTLCAHVASWKTLLRNFRGNCVDTLWSIGASVWW